MRILIGFRPVLPQLLHASQPRFFSRQISRCAFPVHPLSKSAADKTAENILTIVSNTASRLKREHAHKREPLKQLITEIGHTAVKKNVPAKIIHGMRSTIADGISYIIVPAFYNNPQCSELSCWLKSRGGNKQFSLHIEGMVRDAEHERQGVQVLKKLMAFNDYPLATDGYLFGMEDRGFPELLHFGDSFHKLRQSANLQGSDFQKVLFRETRNLCISLSITDTGQIWEEFEASPGPELEAIYRSCVFEEAATPASRLGTLTNAFNQQPMPIQLYIELFKQLTLLSLKKLPITEKQKTDLIRDFLNNPDIEDAYQFFTSDFHAPMRDPIMVRNIQSVRLPSDVIRVIEVGAWHVDNMLDLIHAK